MQFALIENPSISSIADFDSAPGQVFAIALESEIEIGEPTD
jgi:hypothetical protein